MVAISQPCFFLCHFLFISLTKVNACVKIQGVKGDNRMTDTAIKNGCLFTFLSMHEAELTSILDTDIKEVSIPKAVENHTVIKIHSCAFQACENIKRVYLPDTLKTIGRSAFEHCYGLETVTQSREGVGLIIEDFAFHGCIKLTKVHANIECIKSFAFASCAALRVFIFGADCVEIGPQAFMDCNLLTIMFYASNGQDLSIWESSFNAANVQNVFTARCFCIKRCINEDPIGLERLFSPNTKYCCTKDSNCMDLAYCGYDIQEWKK